MMMRDYINIGSTPPAEDCQQLGSPSYSSLAAKKQCFRFIAQLRKQFGLEPDRCRLEIKAFDHDFGTYYEVVCWYDDEEGEAYALRCEGEAWEEWRDEEEANDEKGAK